MHNRHSGQHFIVLHSLHCSARNRNSRRYGRAASIEVIRRLKLHPEVELIATSHRKGNQAAARLYRSLGFVDWDIAWARDQKDEVFLKLEDPS